MLIQNYLKQLNASFAFRYIEIPSVGSDVSMHIALNE
jgi:hypothetical protein